VDLKSFSNDTYMRLNAGELEPVLNTFKIMKKEGVWVEITNLVVPGWTDDLGMIEEMCNWLYDNGFKDSPLHFSRFTPMYKLKHLSSTPVETLNRARKIAMNAGLNYVYIGNVPGSEGEDTLCPECGEKIIDRRGFFIRENHMDNGKCGHCGHTIAGVWGK
jgi:pyruvate formate lyase activating enzyme